MAHKVPRNPADYIVPLNINGMEGRMLFVPAPKGKKKDILFVYGHHSSLERWWGVMEVFNRYGSVTMPDLPGFGGMDSFYTIGKKPSIDAMADYLAAFIKMQFKRKKIVLAGMSFGFVVATRMLQMYPELSKNVSLLVSIVGFSHRDDFLFSRPRRWSYLALARTFKHRPFSWAFRYIALNQHVLRAAYARTPNAKHKFKSLSGKEEFDRTMDVEIGLWQSNEVRTYMYTTVEMLNVDNCKQRVNLPVWHVSSISDHFFNTYMVEQHLQVIFTGFHSVQTDLGSHAPSVIADAKTAAPLVPPALRRVLARKS
jgi:pimeloyl-ACP methyl ester carboxylesterase